MKYAKNRLLLVDGSNLLFQMFFGMPARIFSANGTPMQGTLGFTGALLKIMRQTQPTHVAVFFDGEQQNPRTLLSADYKANRIDYSQVEETPFSQLNDICAALDFLGISYAEASGCEADDLIASYVSALKQTECIISSLDSDFFQLITETVSVLRYRGKNTVLCTPEYITQKFGISAKQYIDFKALTGDVSDNIKGADKIGPKTAARLLHEFGTLENLLLHAEKIKQAAIKTSVLKNTERLKTNYKLIQLNDLIPLPFPLSTLAYQDAGYTTTEVLKEIGLKK